MKKKNKLIIFLITLLVIIVLIVLGIYLYKDKNNIPDDYIAVFYGGSGEVTYSTYIYKIDNGHANYGFRYINTTNTTTSWGSSTWEIKITARGEVSWTDDVFVVAKENNAYSYVKIPNSNKTYSPEEFMKIFLMN